MRITPSTRRTARGPDTYNHYALGWAHALRTPLQWTQQIATSIVTPAKLRRPIPLVTHTGILKV
jgi:hypothetical protein